MNRICLSILSPVIFIALLLLSGCSPEKNEKTADNQVKGESSPRRVTSVELLSIVRADVQQRFTLPGALQAWEDLTLSAEVAGPVNWIGPQEGERLKKGETILTIDPQTWQANYDRDKVEAELQKKKLDRFQRLVEQNLVSQQEYENSVNAYERARVAARLSALQLAKSSLKVPVAGILDNLLVDRGEYVRVGDPLALVVQINRLKVEVDVPEKDIGYLQIGEKIEVVQANIGREDGIVRAGKLTHLAYKADPVTRTYRAVIEIDNPDHVLRPGMIVRIEAVRRLLPQVVAIPLYALLDRDGKKVVFVKKGGEVELREVEVEAVVDAQVVIRSGLEAGEELIIKGQHLLVDGAPVQVGVQ